MPSSQSRACSVLLALVCVPGVAATQTNWTLLSPTTSPPTVTAHAMAYYRPTDQTVLFGGVHAGSYSNQMWLWDGSDWTQATPSVLPPARVAHTMVYEEPSARLLVFGGIGVGGGLLGDTWVWNGWLWQQKTPQNQPPARRSHAMAYMPNRSTVVLWGGYNGTDLNDMWEWNGVNWMPINTIHRPPARRATDIAYDPVNHGLILFSGYQQPNDTWFFNGTDWVQLATPVAPPARYDHSMVTDMVRRRIVLFGGPTADTWEWDGLTWLQRSPATLPAARTDTYLAYDEYHEEVLMFGSSPTPETWRYAPTHNATIATAGVGCPSSAGQTPYIAPMVRPWIGETFTARVVNVPANTIALMIYGFSDTFSPTLGPLPVSLAGIGMPGCTLQVDSALIDSFPAAGTIATWNLALPNSSALLGGKIYCQGAAIDPAANAFGAIVSNHAELTVGGK